MERANRQPTLWLSVLALLLECDQSWFYPTGDGSMYLSTVREFLSSEDLSEFRCFVPPGYVAMILPTFLISDRPFLALSIMNWFLGVALLIGVYYWCRRQFPSVAVLLTAIVMVNISVWTYYRRPLKETAFMVVLIWTVNLLHGFKARTRVAICARRAALLALLSLIRYPGITVAIGFGQRCSCRRFAERSRGPRLRDDIRDHNLPITLLVRGSFTTSITSAVRSTGMRSSASTPTTSTAHRPSRQAAVVRAARRRLGEFLMSCAGTRFAS
jgi:hypothetical protein